jgi:aminoglycoside phosphotransferase (APT) family kinase protein
VSDGVAAGIDVPATARWMRSLGIELTGPLRLERIGLGQSNLTYLVSDEAGGRWVLRCRPSGSLLASAHDIGREARILSSLEPTDVPTPRVLGVTGEPDAPLVLLEYVDGVVVDRMSVARQLTPDLRRRIGLSMVRTLPKVHAVDLPDQPREHEALCAAPDQALVRSVGGQQDPGAPGSGPAHRPTGRRDPGTA